MPQFDLYHLPSSRKLFQSSLERLPEDWTDEEIEKTLEYFKARLLLETKEMARSAPKNMKLEFRALTRPHVAHLQAQVADKRELFRQMHLESDSNEVLLRKLHDTNNMYDEYRMNDLSWLNFGDFITNLVREAQKPLAVYRGSYDLLYVDLLVL
jgi:hypothetical protein